jgi:hypothetical protein
MEANCRERSKACMIRYVHTTIQKQKGFHRFLAYIMLSRGALTVSRRWLSTASYETLHVERHDHGVVHVQLNRPDKRNASRSLLQ